MEKQEKKTKVSGVYLVLAALTVLFAVSLVFLHKTAYEGASHGNYTVTTQDKTDEITAPTRVVTLVNVNTATAEELETLTGIGTSRASERRSSRDSARRSHSRRRMAMKILVVDDEQLLVKGMKFNLENEGYTVETAYDGATAIDMAKSGGFDLIILDLMMPQVDGLTACMRIREFSNVPIIMLTARSEDADKIIGLESGADDYITKPFNILELKARIRALLRRANAAPQQKQPETLLLTAGGITLDPEQRVAVKNGEIVELTAKEYDLIELLVKNPRRVYSRENLMDLVWGYTYAGDYRTVDVHIRRLREKLEENPAAPQHILTKWGVGYYLKD